MSMSSNPHAGDVPASPYWSSWRTGQFSSSLLTGKEPQTLSAQINNCGLHFQMWAETKRSGFHRGISTLNFMPITWVSPAEHYCTSSLDLLAYLELQRAGWGQFRFKQENLSPKGRCHNSVSARTPAVVPQTNLQVTKGSWMAQFGLLTPPLLPTMVPGES